MQTCSICLLATSTTFKECIGQPPATINELILQCTGITLNFDSGICAKCTSKLSRYYEATQVVHQIEKELLDLLHHAIINKELKTNIKAGRYQEATLVESIESKKESSEEAVECNQDEKIFDNNYIEFCFVEQCAEIGEKDALGSVESDLCTHRMERRSYRQERIQSKSSKHEFDADYDISRRKKAVTKTFGIMCSECGLSFPSKRKCRTHREVKHSAGYICEQCGKPFQTQSGLLNHIQGHNDLKKFVCSECGHRFKTKYLMRLHMAWHTGERPFECDICHKRYVHRLALSRHKSIHDEQTRRKECKVCGLKFRSNSHLQRHMLTHTGVKPHSCPICAKCFSQRYNLRVHVQEHEQPGSTRQRRLKCKKCTRTFTNEKNYREHCQRDDCKAAAT